MTPRNPIKADLPRCMVRWCWREATEATDVWDSRNGEFKAHVEMCAAHSEKFFGRRGYLHIDQAEAWRKAIRKRSDLSPIAGKPPRMPWGVVGMFKPAAFSKSGARFE